MERVTTLSTITTVTVWQVLMGPTVITVSEYIFAVLFLVTKAKVAIDSFWGL